MEFLSISDAPRLDTLPDDVLLIILSHLTTAQSVSRLAAASRRLHRVVTADGWRVFVRNRFYNLSIPPAATPAAAGNYWAQFARTLTSQFRDWDRRAFIFHVFTRRRHHHHHHPGRLHGRRPRQDHVYWPNSFQTVPCHVMVDVHSQVDGRSEEETVVWGAGEDLFALKRRKHDHRPVLQEWQEYHQEGDEAGFRAGVDDITSLSILKTSQFPHESVPSVIIGRASGDLRLLSMNKDEFGRTIHQFQPPRAEKAPEQREIMALDTREKINILAAATKDRILLYPIDSQYNAGAYSSETGPARTSLFIEPSETLNLRDSRASLKFRFIRTLKFLNDDTAVVGLSGSTKPLTYLKLSPTGIETHLVPNIVKHNPPDEFRLETVRDILPIDLSSSASGGKNSFLTAWDDGTIRLQDLRTPSAFDRVYQDHFEPTTPVNSLVSYGLERFVAGSARAPVLKFFDFRMSRGYNYTEALPCSADSPTPMPRPPAIVAKPLVAARPRCDYLRGHLCRWHALSKESYYRPNCSIYLPKKAGADAPPIYSLASASDVSPTLYAGLSGTLVEMTLRSSSPADPHHDSSESPNTVFYNYRGAKVNVLETGDGTALSDISQSQRMPIIRAQSERRIPHLQHSYFTKRQRLDELLQDPSDYALLE